MEAYRFVLRWQEVYDIPVQLTALFEVEIENIVCDLYLGEVIFLASLRLGKYRGLDFVLFVAVHLPASISQEEINT